MVALSASYVVGILITLFFVDMAFSAVLLYGLHKDDLIFQKIYYGSLLVAIAILVCCFMDGFVVDIIISLVNLGARVYVLYMLTKLIEETQTPEKPIV